MPPLRRVVPHDGPQHDKALTLRYEQSKKARRLTGEPFS